MSVPLLNFERGPGVPLLNFEGGPGSRVLVPLLHHAIAINPYKIRMDQKKDRVSFFKKLLFFLYFLIFEFKISFWTKENFDYKARFKQQ